MKERPIIMTTESVKAILDGRKTQTRRVVKPQPKLTIADGFYKANIQKLIEGGDRVCPHGQVGDRLWVRETWAEYTKRKIIYKADQTPVFIANRLEKWRPSIFMPRWASRLSEEITGLKVERVQDISLADAIAEGFKSIEEFRDYWNFLNARWKRVRNKELKIYEFWQYPWALEDAKPIPKTAKYPERYHCIPNPWVRVIRFDNIGVRVK